MLFNIRWQTPDGERSDWIWAKDMREAEREADDREQKATNPFANDLLGGDLLRNMPRDYAGQLLANQLQQASGHCPLCGSHRHSGYGLSSMPAKSIWASIFGPMV